VAEIIDYSGEFVTNLNLEHLEHNTLAETARLYTKLLYGLDGIWYKRIREIVGDEKGLACDQAVWDDFIRYEVVMIKRQFKIRGNDLVAYLKVTQLCPWFQLTNSIIQLEGKTRATITVTSCPILESLESKEEVSEANRTCTLVCPRITETAARIINPNIEVSASKLPPRQSKSDVCCQWDFELKSKYKRI
jgi:hypothetical protein